MKTYFEKLKDPRWQEKRLRVMERAKFACENCLSNTNTLHVHHKIYRKGRDPWEYEDHELACLCEQCHEYETQTRADLAEVLLSLEGVEIETVTGYAQGIALIKAWHYGQKPAPDLKVPSNAYLGGMGEALGVDWVQLAKLLDERQILPVVRAKEISDQAHALRVTEEKDSFKG